MRYVIVQSVLFFGLLVAVLAGSGHRVLPESQWFAGCGLALCVATMVLVVAAFRSLGASFCVAPAPHDAARLVVGGIYRHFRHPMYTAAVSGVTGLFLLRPTWGIAVFASSIIVFYLIKARHEEGLLIRRYPEYKTYQQRTRGVIPIR